MNNEFDEESSNQAWSEQQFRGAGSEMPMPRKAIRPQTMETNFPAEEQEPDLNYGVYNEEEQPYAQYAPTPSKAAAQRHMRQSMQKSEKTMHSEAANPLKTALFQFASMLPGMRIRLEGRKADTHSSQDNAFRAPADDRPQPKPSAPKVDDFAPAKLHRKNALDDLKRDDSDRGGGGRSVGTLEQSPIEKFMAKLFPSGNDDQHVQEVEDPAVKRRKAMIRFGVMGAFALLVLGAYKMMPRQTEYFQKYPVDFQSAEKERSVKVVDANSIVYAIGADSSKMPITYFMNDWRDFADVVLSSPFQKQMWLEKTEHGIKDLNSNFEMFEQRAPESISSKEAQKIADNVTAYFNSKHSYPTKGTELGNYFNPYTSKNEPIQIKSVTEGDTKSGEDVDSKRSELYRQLVFEKAKIESKQAPGTIACWNVHFLAAHQDLNVFIIKPYGKNGAPIIGGHTDAQYFIALEDGAPKVLLPAKPLADWIGKDGVLHKQTVLFVNHTDPIVLFILKHAAKIFFTVIAFAAIGFLVSLKRGDSPIFWIFVLVVSGVPALLALLNNFIP